MNINHFSRVFSNLNSLRKQSKLCDIRFLIDGKILEAHKAVLASSSPYFHGMFTTGLREANQNEIIMQGMSWESLKLIIEFMYGEEIEINKNNVKELLIAADMLEMDEVMYMCSRNILNDLDNVNVFEIYQFADEHHNLRQLKNAALHYICNNFSDVCLQQAFVNLNKEQIVEILSSENLVARSEQEVFEAAMNWVKYKISERHENAHAVLRQVRFPLFSIDALELEIEKCPDCKFRNALIAIHLDLTTKNKNYVHLQNKPRTRKQIYALCLQNSKLPKLFAHNEHEENYSLKKFNSLNKEWTEISTSIKCPTIAQISSLDGNIYAIGSDNNSCYCYMYNITKNLWTRKANLKVPRCEFGLCTVNNTLCVVGGWTKGGIGHTIEIYDSNDDTWVPLDNLPEPRCCMGITAQKGEMYIAGGSTNKTRYTNDFWSFNCEQHKWTHLSPLFEPKSQLTLAIQSDILYAVGGNNENGDLKSVESFSLQHKQWTKLPPLKIPRNRPISVFVDGLLHVMGGFRSSYTNLYKSQCNISSVECFNPLTNMWFEFTSLFDCKSATVV